MPKHKPVVQAVSEQEGIGEIKDLCQSSLFFLCQTMLGYRHWDEVHTDVAAFLKRPARKKALLMPRGHLKTSIVTVGFTIQQIIKNPNIRVLIANQIWDKSRDMLSEIKQHFEASQLKHLFGEFVSARWNADEIIVKNRTKALKEPTIATTGVEAETTGGHYDLIILDDLIGLQNSQTPEQRDKTKRFRRSMINLLEPGGLLLEIGTRWHLDDTFSEIFDKEKKYYDIMIRKVVEDGRLIFPSKFGMRFDDVRKDWANDYRVEVKDTNGEWRDVGRMTAGSDYEAQGLAEKKHGENVRVESCNDPKCMDYVDHLKGSMPLDEFSAQYLNEPFSSENQLFKPEMFDYWSDRPEGIYVAMAVDLAISESRTSDFTSIIVCGMDKDWKLYVLDYMRGHWKPTEIVNNVFHMQSRWKPFSVGMETNGFQQTLKLACEDEMRRRNQYFGIDEIRTGPDKSKENRIKSLEPFYRSRSVKHALWMKGKDLENELQTFPKGKNDDIIDSLSMCLPLLSPGDAKTNDEFPVGSFAYVQREAQRYSSRTTNYLNF